MSFSQNLFWDADSSQIDFRANRQYVVGRVLDRGTLSDLKNLLTIYGRDQVIEIALNLRSLEPRALSFISCIADVPREKFRCYTLKQSSTAPWIC